MGIKEQIKYFTENMNYKVAKNRHEQIKNLVEQLGKVVAKGYRERNFNFIITSQDLRTFQIAVSKVHKAMNKKVDFIEFEKRLNKLASKNKCYTL